MSLFYYAIDGDDIGTRLEKYALSNDLDSIKHLTIAVSTCLEEIQAFLVEHSASIIFCAGDSILATSKQNIEITTQILTFDEISFSAGIGSTCCNATLALKKAKGLGKKRIEIIL